jgi:small subunit ribosomal protein S21
MGKTIHAFVKAKHGESIDNLLKRFNMEMQKSGILYELKEREYYEKPSVKRRRKQREMFFRTD